MSPLLAQSGVLLRRANLVAFGAKRTLLVTQLPIAARCHAQCARRAARSLASSCFQLFRPRLSRQAKAAASACLSATTARHLKGSTLWERSELAFFRYAQSCLKRSSRASIISPRGERQDPERDRNGEGDDGDGQAKESRPLLPLSARRLWIVFRHTT